MYCTCNNAWNLTVSINSAHYVRITKWTTQMQIIHHNKLTQIYKKGFCNQLKINGKVQTSSVEKWWCYTKSRLFSTTKPHIFKSIYADACQYKYCEQSVRYIMLRVHDCACHTLAKTLLSADFYRIKCGVPINLLHSQIL